MNKREFARRITSKRKSLGKKATIIETIDVLDTMSDIILEALREGEDIKLSEFLNIKYVDVAEREFIHPATKDVYVVEAHKKPIIKFYKNFLKKI